MQACVCMCTQAMCMCMQAWMYVQRTLNQNKLQPKQETFIGHRGCVHMYDSCFYLQYRVEFEADFTQPKCEGAKKNHFLLASDMSERVTPPLFVAHPSPPPSIHPHRSQGLSLCLAGRYRDGAAPRCRGGQVDQRAGRGCKVRHQNPTTLPNPLLARPQPAGAFHRWDRPRPAGKGLTGDPAQPQEAPGNVKLSAARANLRAVGWTSGDMRKPVVAVVAAYHSAMPRQGRPWLGATAGSESRKSETSSTFSARFLHIEAPFQVPKFPEFRTPWVSCFGVSEPPF